MIGAIGDDEFGRVNLARLKRERVDVAGVVTDPELPTGTAFVRYRRDGSHDFVFNLCISAAGGLDWTGLDWTKAIDEVVLQAGHLHVMGTLLGNSVIWPIIERAAKVIKARGGTVSLDPNMCKELQTDAKTGARISSMMTV